MKYSIIPERERSFSSSYHIKQVTQLAQSHASYNEIGATLCLTGILEVKSVVNPYSGQPVADS